jgi:Right handed beta helix region
LRPATAFAIGPVCLACGAGGPHLATTSSSPVAISTTAGSKPASAALRASGLVVDAGPADSAAEPDDTATIQRLLDAGNVVKLRSALIYHVSRRLDIRVSGSGIVSDDPPATLELTRAFNNINGDEVYALDARSDAIGIHVADGVSGVTLRNLVIRKDVIDGSYVTAIAVRGASRTTLEKLDISGFSLGEVVALDSVDDVRLEGLSIHDCWANRYFLVPDKHGLTRFPQLSGIVVDDNKLDTGNRLSKNVRIVNNTIRRLRFGRELYERPRICFRGSSVPMQDCAQQTLESLARYCESHSCPVVHYQTDGINVISPGQGHVIASNTIDAVGEGIDLILNDGTLLAGNRISNAFGFGIKLVHGTRNVVAEHNVVTDAGLAGIVVAGTSGEGLGDTTGNVIRFNRLAGSGNIDAFCTAAAQAPFRIFESCGALGQGAAGIEVSPNNSCQGATACQYGLPRFNFFFRNVISAAPRDVNMGSAVELQEGVTDNAFYGNVLSDTSGRQIRFLDAREGVGPGNVIRDEPQPSQQ